MEFRGLTPVLIHPPGRTSCLGDCVRGGASENRYAEHASAHEAEGAEERNAVARNARFGLVICDHVPE